MEENIKKDLFQDLPVEARAGMLRGNAYATETEVVQRYHTKEALDEFKDTLSIESVKLASLLEEKAGLVKELDLKIKPVKANVNQIVKDLRNKYEESEEEVFLMDDQENGTMDVFDSLGHFLYSRRLRPSEKQLKIGKSAAGNS